MNKNVLSNGLISLTSATIQIHPIKTKQWEHYVIHAWQTKLNAHIESTTALYHAWNDWTLKMLIKVLHVLYVMYDSLEKLHNEYSLHVDYFVID